MSLKIPSKDKVLSMLGMERKRSPTIIKDSLGNTLVEGTLVLWLDHKLIARVSELKLGGIVDPSNGQPSPGELVLEIRMPFNVPPQPVVVVNQFMAIVDPTAKLPAVPSREPEAEPSSIIQ